LTQAADLPADLHHAVAVLAETGDPALLRVADSLKLWLESENIKFEQALGTASNWRSVMRRRRRDEIYVEIFPDLRGVSRRARAITEAIDRYQTSSWRHDRDSGRRPAGVNGLIYDLLSLGERLLDVEALRKLPGILRAGEYQNQDLHSDEQEENLFECDGQDQSVFEGSKSG
jgi:hypothetical protein